MLLVVVCGLSLVVMSRGLSLVARFLIAVAFLVAEHGLYNTGSVVVTLRLS